MLARLKQQLFRWRSDGTAPFRLGQRRIFILPTRAGVLFAAALLVMLIGAINYNLALGHALVFLLAGLGLAGMVHTFRNLYGLQISPGRCEPVFAGEIARFPLQLTNDRATPRLALTLAVEPALTVTAAVNAENSTKTAVLLTANQRGWLPLPRVRLATEFPLGLFHAWSYLQPEMRCLVYPKPAMTPLPPPVATDLTGQLHGEGGQEDFAGFRDRQPADSPRHVAWKASARNPADRPLLIKQFAGGASSELRLRWQDTDAHLDTEQRLSLLTGWVMAADAAGCAYGLSLPGQEIAVANGPAHRLRCLEALALATP